MTTTAPAPDTRQHLLDTAEELMAVKGYSAVGLTEVLSTAGVPKGSFYHYFASKEAFGEAVLAGYFSAYLAGMDRTLAATGRTGGERMMTYWTAFYDRQNIDRCQGRCLVVKLSAEVADLSEPMRVALRDGTVEIVRRIDRTLAAGVADGSIRIDGTPQSFATTLYATWVGSSVLAKLHRDPAPLDAAMTATRHLLHA